MAERLDTESRGILEFRPNIYFIEPEVGPGIIDPVEVAEPTELSDIMAQMDQGKKLANAVNLLSEAMQARVDKLATGLVVALDPLVDAPVVSAVKHLYPDANPEEITYPQYKECKERQLNKAEEMGAQAVISPEEFAEARKQVAKDGPLAGLKEENKDDTGIGFQSKKAKQGGLRPELQKKFTAQVVDPLDLVEFQISALKMLMNFLWQMFIKPFLCKILPPPASGAVCDSDDVMVGSPLDPRARNFIGAADKVIKPRKKAQNIAAIAGVELPQQSPDERAPPGLKDIFPVTPASEFLKTQDCITITRTFERGAAYSTQTESVYALLTPFLNAQRSLSKAFVKNIESYEGMVDSANVVSPGLERDADGQPIDDDPSFLEDAAGWFSDCIPCLDRLTAMGPAAANLGGNLWDALAGPYAAMYEYFKIVLGQLQDLLGTLFAPASDRFGDICALWKWMTDFVCIPDLRKIIAALSALLMKLALEISAIFDLLLILVAPLMMPVLLGLTGVINAFLDMVLAPIECIIDSLITQIDKLDYRELYSTGNYNVNIGIGKGYTSSSHETQVGQVSTVGRRAENEVVTDVEFPAFKSPQVMPDGAVEGQQWGWGFSGSINPFEYRQLELEEATREANRELNEIRRQRHLVDFTNDAERKAYQQRLEEAKQKRDDAARESHSNFSTRSTNWLKKFKADLRNIIHALTSYLREIIDSIRAWFTGLVKELQKLLGGLTGQGNTMGLQLLKKMEIIELLSFVTSLISFLSKGISCDDLEGHFADIAKEQSGQNSVVLTNKDGTVTIYENPDDLAAALDAITIAEGVDPNAKLPGRVSGNILSEQLPGTALDQSRQKLKSLIELTGDPLLDTQISEAVDALTTPKQTTFKCPYDIQRTDVEQVNRWMEELNAS